MALVQTRGGPHTMAPADQPGQREIGGIAQPTTDLRHASKDGGRVGQSVGAARPAMTGDEWWRLLPPGTSGDALRVLAARGARAFADGFVALLLPIYLVEIGFNSLAVGAIVASTLIGTALLTLWVGLIANRHSRRKLLLAASILMAATGAAFATVTAFWPLLIIAFVGTINPTSGDASVFQPLEQTVLTQTIEPRRRTALFARYSVIGSLAGAAGVLAAR